MSNQKLADACMEIGFDIPRAVLANLELRRRETITVPELLVIARGLDVPPISLLFPPVEVVNEVEFLPGSKANSENAAQWFCGEVAFEYAVKPCLNCEGSPPSGFTCNACGKRS